MLTCDEAKKMFKSNEKQYSLDLYEEGKKIAEKVKLDFLINDALNSKPPKYHIILDFPDEYIKKMKYYLLEKGYDLTQILVYENCKDNYKWRLSGWAE